MHDVAVSDDLTPYGELLESARGSTSKRQAARDANISEGRWRQIVTGRQNVGNGQWVPARPKRETLIAMARAVRADVAAVLEAAGMDVGGLPEDADYVAAPGETDQSVRDDQVLAELRAIREDVNALSRRVAGLESGAKPVGGLDGPV